LANRSNYYPRTLRLQSWEVQILVPEREKGRATTGIEYKLENKFGLLFNLKVDYGFRHGSNKKSTRFSTGLGYKF
jgi:hypothetical protein